MLARGAGVVSVATRTRTLLAWSLWLATLGRCAGGLLAALLWIRPLTLGLLARGAGAALVFPLGYATIGLVLTLRRPANPIGWLYAASGLVWALVIPFEPWLQQLLRDHQPLPLVAQLAVVASQVIWAPAIALGITLPFLLLPDGRLAVAPLAAGGDRRRGRGRHVRGRRHPVPGPDQQRPHRDRQSVWGGRQGRHSTWTGHVHASRQAPLEIGHHGQTIRVTRDEPLTQPIEPLPRRETPGPTAPSGAPPPEARRRPPHCGRQSWSGGAMR
jgi:hypothetical protein